MKSTILALVAIGAIGVAQADYTVSDKGTWPKTWPAEMEPLRGQARSLRGSLADLTHHEIPFTTRESFEAAWPHILRVKSKGAPVLLSRSPDTWMGRIEAGVRIHCPPPSDQPEAPINTTRTRERWMYTTYIELIVDGKIVDLNRIPLPPDGPVIDERFQGGK